MERRKLFSEPEGEEKKRQKRTKTGREIGMAGTSALVGLGAGLAIHRAAKKSPDAVKKVHDRILYEKSGTPGYKVSRWTMENPKTIALEEKTAKINEKAEKISKFAKSGAGKAVLIGVPTLVAGGIAYTAAKKKSKKKEEKKDDSKKD